MWRSPRDSPLPRKPATRATDHASSAPRTFAPRRCSPHPENNNRGVRLPADALASRLPPPTVDDQVARRSVEEPPAVLVIRLLWTGAQQAKKRLLHDVVGVCRTRRHLVHIAPQHAGRATVERRERRLVQGELPFPGPDPLRRRLLLRRRIQQSHLTRHDVRRDR